MNPFLRLALEAGPLAVFFFTNAQAGLMTGTAAFMLATALSLGLSWRLERRLPIMPLVGCGFVMLFGGLTLWLNDETFIKLKPTLVNLLFAGALFTAHFLRRNLLKRLLGTVMRLSEDGWRILALRWAFFFLALAVINEIVWRNFPTDVWVNFKVFGIMPLTLVFSALQTPLILKHQIPEDAAADAAATEEDRA
jgi:intracellular septation protein